MPKFIVFKSSKKNCLVILSFIACTLWTLTFLRKKVIYNFTIAHNDQLHKIKNYGIRIYQAQYLSQDISLSVENKF